MNIRRTVVAAGLVGVLLLAGLVLLRQGGPVEEGLNSVQPDSVLVPAGNIATELEAVAVRGDAARDPTATDLRDASETFRNSTLLSAIRRAGFYCVDVISAHESMEEVWLAGCSDVIRYLVTVRGPEEFDVHPVAYGDSVAPVPDRSHEQRPLEPQPLR